MVKPVHLFCLVLLGVFLFLLFILCYMIVTYKPGNLLIPFSI